MQEQEAVAATVQACLLTWSETVSKAAAAGYTFCLVGYFEIADSEHYLLFPLLGPLMAEMESKGYQALFFKPNQPSVYDKTGSNVVGYAQNPWHALDAGPPGAQSLRDIQIHSNHYVRTRDVTVDDPPPAADDVRGIALPATELPTFRTRLAGQRLIAAVGVCWHRPRLR